MGTLWGREGVVVNTYMQRVGRMGTLWGREGVVVSTCMQRVGLPTAAATKPV